MDTLFWHWLCSCMTVLLSQAAMTAWIFQRLHLQTCKYRSMECPVSWIPNSWHDRILKLSDRDQTVSRRQLSQFPKTLRSRRSQCHKHHPWKKLSRKTQWAGSSYHSFQALWRTGWASNLIKLTRCEGVLQRMLKYYWIANTVTIRLVRALVSQQSTRDLICWTPIKIA